LFVGELSDRQAAFIASRSVALLLHFMQIPVLPPLSQFVDERQQITLKFLVAVFRDKLK
jgi:hypothetical protein